MYNTTIYVRSTESYKKYRKPIPVVRIQILSYTYMYNNDTYTYVYKIIRRNIYVGIKLKRE